MPWERNKQTKTYKSKRSNWFLSSPCTAAYWLPTGADSELTRLAYDNSLTVSGVKVEPSYREVAIFPRLY
ncbi:hypothetical protein KJ885_03700 [Patescibacteria group bacterium]|nr:hypothetical protein [Patescibacteria group bacterium]